MKKCDAWMRLDLPRSRSVSSAQLLMLSLVTQSIKSNAYQATFPPLATVVPNQSVATPHLALVHHIQFYIAAPSYFIILKTFIFTTTFLILQIKPLR